MVLSILIVWQPESGIFRKAQTDEEDHVGIEEVLKDLKSKYYKRERVLDESSAAEHLAMLLFELDDMEVFGMLQEYLHENQEKYRNTLDITHKIIKNADPSKAKVDHKGFHLDFKVFRDMLQSELNAEMRGDGPMAALFH